MARLLQAVWSKNSLLHTAVAEGRPDDLAEDNAHAMTQGPRLARTDCREPYTLARYTSPSARPSYKAE